MPPPEPPLLLISIGALAAQGTIFPVLDLNLAGVELEGLVLSPRPDGSLLHTLDVTSARTGVELRHHTIAREPLRWKVCP